MQKNDHHIADQKMFCGNQSMTKQKYINFLNKSKIILFSFFIQICLGIPAVTSRNAMLIHMQYRIGLPDHDFPVASSHKLTPSVRVLLRQTPGVFGPSALTNDGPMFINNRSAKHCKATAFIHAKDFDTMIEDPEFDIFTKNNDKVKPIVMRLVDGGPDQNPRFKKVISSAIRQFKMYNLDAIVILTNAPGRSAFNIVERRMATLSKHLAGVILPYDSYGSHLDSQHRTVDKQLELKNFEKAAEVLEQCWKDIVVNGYKTKVSYVSPDNSEIETPPEEPEEWKAKHVQTSKYATQIAKCFDRSCCSAPRSSWFNVNPERFIPAPVRLKAHSLEPSMDPSDDGHFIGTFQSAHFGKVFFEDKIPFDKFCPSQKTFAYCNVCDIYFATAESLKSHNQIHRKRAAQGRKKPQAKKQKQNPIIKEETTEEVTFEEISEDERVELDIENVEEIPSSGDENLPLPELSTFEVAEILQECC